MEVLSTPTNRKTWVEELHLWLQLNPLTVDIVQVAARQVPIITLQRISKMASTIPWTASVSSPCPWQLWNQAHCVETSSSTLTSQYSS